MDTIIQNLINFFTQIVDYKLALLLLLSSFWVKKNCSDFLPQLKLVHKVFIWSILVTLVYWIVLVKTGLSKERSVYNYVLTYFFVTSFYELLWEPVERWIVKSKKEGI